MAMVDNAGEKTCLSKLNVKVKNVTISKHCIETVLHDTYRLCTPMQNETNSSKQVLRIVVNYAYTLIKCSKLKQYTPVQNN